ncbi:hypothetical protein C8J56DRAFT_1045833 [Mycena floridula]|nr:hypothetical protein C8J56DRAFT_1045833 [Mycena floridula]
MAMNAAAILNIFGINPNLTDEQAREIRATLEAEEEMIRNLDLEIANAQAQLQKLQSERNVAERLLHSNSVPTDAQQTEIRAIVAQKELELERCIAEMGERQAALELLVAEREKVDSMGDQGMSTGNDIYFDALEEPTDVVLERLENDISAHNMALRRLTSQRDQVMISLEEYNIVLSPIRRLPVEVLGEIFLRCLPDHLFIIPSPRSAPLLLGQICRSWRALNLNMPRMWSSISIKISVDATVIKRSVDPSLIELWLQRSTLFPLSFRITENLTSEELDQASNSITTADVLVPFIPHYSRWQTIRLDSTDWRIKSGLHQLPRALPPPLLQNLTVARDYWIQEDVENLRILLSAPGLQELTWRCRHSRLDPISVIPLASMTSLWLDGFVVLEQFRFTLEKCPSLVSCHFAVLSDKPDEYRPILLPRLTSLDLTVSGKLEIVLDGVTTPALKSLKLAKSIPATTPDGRFWHVEKVAKLVKSATNLEIIELVNSDVVAGEFIELLRLIPTLRELAISGDGDYLTMDVLDALTHRHGLTNAEGEHLCCLCPKLKCIKLWSPSLSAPDGRFADMVESRSHKCGGCIEALTMILARLRPVEAHRADVTRLEAMNKMPGRFSFTLL